MAAYGVFGPGISVPTIQEWNLATGRMLLHLINFDVERTPRVENIEVCVRAGGDGAKVSVIPPDEEGAQTLASVRRNGALAFTVPSLKVYDVVVIS